MFFRVIYFENYFIILKAFLLELRVERGGLHVIC